MRTHFRMPAYPLLAALLAVPPAAAQPVRPADNATAARISDGVEKVRDGKLLDAVEQFQRVLDTAGDDLVPVDQGQLVPARWAVHGHLARLSPEGLRLYRQRIDGQAVKRLDEAKKARDDLRLHRLLADMFAARATEEAVLELARRAFERGDFDAAEHFWRMLLPPQRDDHRILRFPDPKTKPAAVLARLVLLQLFRGERDEAASDLKALRETYADEAGPLAGKTGKYVDTLTELLNDPARTTLPPPPDEPGWPTFAGSVARTGTGRAKLPYFWPNVPEWKVPLGFRRPKEDDSPPPDPLHPRSLAFHPVVSGGRAYIADGARIQSFNTMTGAVAKAAWPDGGEEMAVPTRQDVRFTLTEADGTLYARLGPAALRAGEGATGKSFIVALARPKPGEVAREVLWRLDPPVADGTFTHFEGAPVVHGSRLYVGLWRQAGAEMHAGVACYRIDDPRAAPDLVWQRIVGRAMSEPNGETRHRHFLVTVSGPNVVYNTNGGTVIALDGATGQPAWEYRYPRNERPALPRYRDLCPPLADGGRVYAAPPDTDRLLCLDAYTGRLIWEREGVDVVHLLGVARGRLIATFGGQVRGIRGLNLRTGSDSGSNGWTIHDDGGEATFGRGLVTEEAVVWPTRQGLHFLDPSDGRPLRSPIPGPFGNLCYADGVLMVTTATELWGFVSEGKKLGDRRKAVRDDPENSTRHAELAQSLIDAGKYAEGEAEATKAGEAKDRLRWLLAEKLTRDGNRDGAKRLYKDLAKGDGSFAAAGAVRLAEVWPNPDRDFEAWQLVRWKKATIRDRHGVPWPARTYAEAHSPVPLVMGRIGFPGDDFDEPLDPDRWIPNLSGMRLTRAHSTSFADPSLRILDTSEAGVLTTGEQTAMFPIRAGLPLPRSATLGVANTHWGIVSGHAGVAAVWLNGASISWEVSFRSNMLMLARIDRPWLPSAIGVADAPDVSPVHFGRRGISFVVGGRSIGLLSWNGVDQEVYTLPDNRTADFLPVHSFRGSHLLSQTGGGRMIVFTNSFDGRGRHSYTVCDFPATTKPWPEPPPFVDRDRCLIPDDGSVVLFDAKAGKELARHTLPGPDSLTGELPRFRIHKNDVILLVDRNHGVEVDRLRVDGLKRVWESPVFVGRTLDDVAFTDDRFVIVTEARLVAHGWKDGKPHWEIPLPEVPHAKWKLAVAPQGLLAYPAEAILRQPGFDAVGEFRRAGWDGAALLRAVGRTYDVWVDRELPVLVVDPDDGRLVQRLTFPAAGPAAGVAVTPKGVVVVTGKGSWTLAAR